jgi:hypothetical protein
MKLFVSGSAGDSVSARFEPAHGLYAIPNCPSPPAVRLPPAASHGLGQESRGASVSVASVHAPGILAANVVSRTCTATACTDPELRQCPDARIPPRHKVSAPGRSPPESRDSARSGRYFDICVCGCAPWGCDERMQGRKFDAAVRKGVRNWLRF